MLLFRGENSPSDTLQFLEEKISLGLWIWDLKTRNMDWSPGMFRLLGLAPGSVEPSYALYESMVHPDDRRPPGEIEHILSRAGPIEREFRIVLCNHRCRHIRNRGEVLLSDDGRPDRAVGIWLDVTRQQEALLSLEALRQQFSRIIDAVPAMVWIVTPHGRLEQCSGWQRFTQQPIAIGRAEVWLDAVHPEDRPRASQRWKSAMGSHSAFELEFRLHRADGVYRWLRARGCPIFNSDGILHEWMVVAIDIHEQKVWSAATEFSGITGAQLRAARGLLNWSVRQLAEAASVSASVVRRLEEINGWPTEPEEPFQRIKKTLEGAGLEFLYPPLGKPGVRPL
jgi:PAS domain S-box-containing protein